MLGSSFRGSRNRFGCGSFFAAGLDGTVRQESCGKMILADLREGRFREGCLTGGRQMCWVEGMNYRITLVEEPEGGFSVFCDDISGCCSQGDTREEAIENIRSCIQEMLECMAEDGIEPEPWEFDGFEGAASVEHLEIEAFEEAFA